MLYYKSNGLKPIAYEKKTAVEEVAEVPQQEDTPVAT